MTDVAANEALRRSIEATRLGFGLTEGAIRDFVRGAGELGVGGICVPPLFVAVVRETIAGVDGWTPDLVSVANFPTGDHDPALVERVAANAVRDGADHIDVVVPGSLVFADRFTAVEAFVARVRAAAVSRAARGADFRLKVILETAALDDHRMRNAARAAIAGGADWLKTSTGFHPSGGASEDAVRLLRSLAPPGVGVKASGGIRTRAAARLMLAAGADRIGTSSELSILAD